MLAVLRFICMALLLIGVALVLPTLELGGRYLILLESFFFTGLVQLWRNLIGIRISRLLRSGFSGFLIVVTLFLAKRFFHGVNLTIMGILTLYVGTVLLEMILPDHYSNEVWRNEEEEKHWKQ
ncbi:MAG TPA: hypothetical protein DDW65_06090 [Firmicutes bacterium]|nr:hypothetical protein [Bacillota bacterium]